MMKREQLESYLGKTVEVVLFDGTTCRGMLKKTGTEEFKDDLNLYLVRGRYLVISNDSGFERHSVLFRLSHVKKLREC